MGSFFATVAEEEHPSWKMVAATDSSGGIYDPAGLPAKELSEYKAKGGKLVDYKQGQKISNEDLISLDVDVLVLAALEDSVTDKNASKVKAQILLELGNGPVSYSAYKELSSIGKIIVPDILANAGGVIVSYLEWLQNRSGESWSEEKVNTELEEYLVEATDEIYKTATQKNITLKEAAFAIASERLLQ